MKSSSTSLRKTTLALAVLAACTTFVTQASAAGATDSVTKPGSGLVKNPYAPQYEHPYRHGAMPTRQVYARMKEWDAAHTLTTSEQTLTKGASVAGVGVLDGQSKVYLVFYGTQWGTSSTDANGNLKFTGDTAGAAGAAQQMFKGIGTNGELWSAELTQWCDDMATGASSCAASDTTHIPYQQNILAGVWYDNSAASPASATAAQLATEANKAAGHFGNTTSAANRFAYYVILSPKGTNPDAYQNSYCAWHDYTPQSNGNMAYSNQPYNIDSGAGCGVGFVNSPGTLDGFTMTLGHEWHEMMSDQFPAGGMSNHGTGTHAGQENSDECAWIAAGSTGGAANVSFATGTFAEQASWSNDTNNCAISHAIVPNGGGGSTPVANFTSSTSGLTATFTDSSTDTGATITAHAWNFGDGATSTATSPSHTYTAGGTYSVSDKVTDSLNNTNTKTSPVTVTGPSNSVLQNGVGVTISDSTVNHAQNWTVAIPAGSTNLNITMSGGTGDPDLYVKFGSAPTTSSYDCRPYVSGPAESCPFPSPSAGTYYVMVNTYAAYSGTTLKATWTPPGSGGTPTANFTFTTSGLTANFTDTSTDAGGSIGSHAWNFGDGVTSTTASPSHTYAAAGTYSASETVTDSVDGLTSSKTASVPVAPASCGGLVLCNGAAVALPAESTGSWTSIYTMPVLAGHTATFAISGGTPDADIYVKAGSAPTLSSYNCRPYTSTSTESCSFSPTVNTTYYIGVEAYQSFSGVSLKGTSN